MSNLITGILIGALIVVLWFLCGATAGLIWNGIMATPRALLRLGFIHFHFWSFLKFGLGGFLKKYRKKICPKCFG